MAPSLHRGLSERQLRWWLSCFFLALAIPAVLLIYRAYDQLKWEVFHQYRVSAEELTARIDAELSHSIEIEEARSFSDYAFLTVAGEASAGFVQRSPLSAFPVKAGIPGLVGYFQVDSRGTLTSPVVPDPGTDHEAYGVSDDEYRRRLALSEQLQYVLGDPLDEGGRRRDKDAAMAPVVVKEKAVEWRAAADAKADSINETQNVFDRLSSTLGKAARRQTPGDYGRVEDLQLDSRLEKKSREQKLMQPAAPPRPFTSGKRESRKERVAVYELAEQGDPDLAAVEEMEADDGFSSPAPTTALLQPEVSAGSVVTPAPRVRLFESEIDPFGFELLDAVHFVMFRNVWRGGERFIQGAVIERAAFIEESIAAAYRAAALSNMSDLLAAYEGDVIAAHGTGPSREYLPRSHELRGELLYRSRLSAPLGGLELIYSVTQLPLGPGARYLAWLTLLLGLVLSGGCYVIYRYGIGQISLYRQQQDFVSAVSHELKTPLTSIRMYSEMLKAGWADEEKKAGYYAFIHEESERLSRLISNVLQLARMTRGNHSVTLKSLRVGELLDVTRSKITSLIQGAGFELHTDVDPGAAAATLSVDPDAFTQIMINIVDNAIKFSPPDAERRIDLGCALQRDGSVCFTVRDYGSGVPKDQMRRIFELFYRPQSELTRETVGTGIGLALVQQLTTAMHGRVDAQNRSPGAEFSLVFPGAKS